MPAAGRDRRTHAHHAVTVHVAETTAVELEGETGIVRRPTPLPVRNIREAQPGTVPSVLLDHESHRVAELRRTATGTSHGF